MVGWKPVGFKNYKILYDICFKRNFFIPDCVCPRYFPISRHLKPYRSFVFISQSLFNKISYLLLVNTFSFRLNIFLIPGNTKPSKNFENCLFCPENNSGPISILNTHYKFTLSMLGEKIIEECGS